MKMLASLGMALGLLLATQTSAAAKDCFVTLDRAPVFDEFFFMSGTDFAPDTDVILTFQGPNGLTYDTSGVTPAGLHTDAQGSFGPYDIAFTSDTDPAGDWTITATDGDCSADAHVTLLPKTETETELRPAGGTGTDLRQLALLAVFALALALSATRRWRPAD